ncbi:MAG: hypothetical protein M0P39_12360 [Rhodocyclaceae bacterium]|nr:hypothetical protein [Rhodocyclaceae bacterium]
MPAHLFVDISSHGFGHLGQTAPVLAALQQRLPGMRLTVRSGLPASLLQARIGTEFVHIDAASDFGFVQRDAVSIDHVATRRAYREAHRDFDRCVAQEAEFLAGLAPDLVLSNVAYLPLAGARRAGMPSVAMSSLNWFDLATHFYSEESWALRVTAEIREAYAAADCMFALTPGMPMAGFPRRQPVGPVACIAGAGARAQVRAALGVGERETLVLVATGGFDLDIPLAGWPQRDDLRYLVPAAWQSRHPAALGFGLTEFDFTALLRAADVVLTKPGYGTFVEAACNGVPLLYLRREDWPEQEFLIRWLRQYGRCNEVAWADLASGTWLKTMDRLLAQPFVAAVAATGADEVAIRLAGYLER